MLYETLLQPVLFGVLCLVGFLCGFLFDLKNFMLRPVKFNFWAGLVVDLALTVMCGLVILCVVLWVSGGAVRIWNVLSFLAAFAVQRASIGEKLAKKMGVCYNLPRKAKRRKMEKENPS